MKSAIAGLRQQIVQEITSSGGYISFRRFMELALYDPIDGYYASGKAILGKNGDFFTSVSVGAIYGRILASVCREVWEILGQPEEFIIVEQGANDGSMAHDILGFIGASEDSFARSINYLIVEPFEVNASRQRKKLCDHHKVSWLSSVADLPPFTGIHLSNELLDAFPVHSLRWNGKNWEEESVGQVDDELTWVVHPIACQALASLAKELPSDLPAGFRVEVNPGLTPWLNVIFEKLRRGLVLTVDYGQAGVDRYAPHRADGTLLAYKDHRRFTDLFKSPGDHDITAQVDFTALARSARKIGFEILGYNDQHHFLVGAAESWLRTLGDLTPKSDDSRSDLRSLQMLLNPATMGMQFKAIGLGKKLPAKKPLSCFKYQRPGIDALNS